jgi:hypothetical protein
MASLKDKLSKNKKTDSVSESKNIIDLNKGKKTTKSVKDFINSSPQKLADKRKTKGFKMKSDLIIKIKMECLKRGIEEQDFAEEVFEEYFNNKS